MAKMITASSLSKVEVDLILNGDNNFPQVRQPMSAEAMRLALNFLVGYDLPAVKAALSSVATFYPEYLEPIE